MNLKAIYRGTDREQTESLIACGVTYEHIKQMAEPIARRYDMMLRERFIIEHTINTIPCKLES